MPPSRAASVANAMPCAGWAMGAIRASSCWRAPCVSYVKMSAEGSMKRASLNNDCASTWLCSSSGLCNSMSQD
eukprot:6557825-Pyramimonas_sp.AAC.1